MNRYRYLFAIYLILIGLALLTRDRWFALAAMLDVLLAYCMPKTVRSTE